MGNKLTAKQERFVAEYLIDLNASAAARRAGYSEKTADAIGRENLGKPTVAQFIQKSMREREARTEITQDRIVRELALIAFGNKKAVMKWGPGGVELKDSEGLSDEDAAQVAEVKETTSASGGSLSLKTHDKVKALELLGRHVGMFTDKMEVTGKNGGPIQQANVTPAELAEAVRSVRDQF